MKKLLLALVATATLASCSDEVKTLGVINTTNGFYKVDLYSASVAGWAGGVNSSESFESLCILAFDYGTMNTMRMDSVVTAIPTLGVNYEQNWRFATELTDTSLEIGTETWYLARISNGDIHISRYTEYNGMGQDIQTMVLTEL
jgi:hypothetical protein